MVGMNYYLPALAEWRSGLPGHLVAWAAERLAATYNDLLDRVYNTSGARVANVFGAFDTADFAEQGTTPRNVALLCQWTWECAAPPRGPTSTPTSAAIRSSPVRSCKPLACAEQRRPELQRPGQLRQPRGRLGRQGHLARSHAWPDSRL